MSAPPLGRAAIASSSGITARHLDRLFAVAEALALCILTGGIYDALAPEFEIAAELLRARLRAGLSQADLAARMGTSQSTIARLESGQTLPSTKTLLRYAEATGSRFHVRLSAAY